ncbi:MAG: Maf-like protein [Alphaproteobacteria bacterium]|nr:MAG: Maf-like protein [Alphaproteobacteria bacterium]
MTMPDGGSAGRLLAPRLELPGGDGAPPVILASASAPRARLLAAAGVRATQEAAAVDEAEVKRSLAAEKASAAQVAEALAELKASKISRRHPEALVIGCDQMLDCDGSWFDKPDSRAAARDQLLRLSGRRHRLVTAVVVLRRGERLWHHIGAATLAMRPLSPEFIDAYLDAAGDAALSSVGAYQLEGLGAQLFARVDGDYFTILGLPLLPLLDFLRHHGVLPA